MATLKKCNFTVPKNFTSADPMSPCADQVECTMPTNGWIGWAVAATVWIASTAGTRAAPALSNRWRGTRRSGEDAVPPAVSFAMGASRPTGWC
jgi:hypothetical protein